MTLRFCYKILQLFITALIARKVRMHTKIRHYFRCSFWLKMWLDISLEKNTSGIPSLVYYCTANLVLDPFLACDGLTPQTRARFPGNSYHTPHRNGLLNFTRCRKADKQKQILDFAGQSPMKPFFRHIARPLKYIKPMLVDLQRPKGHKKGARKQHL